MAETFHPSFHRSVSLKEIADGLAYVMETTLDEIRQSGRDRASLQTRRRISLAIKDKRMAPGTPNAEIGTLIGRSRGTVSDYTSKSRPVDSFTCDQVNLLVEGFLHTH